VFLQVGFDKDVYGVFMVLFKGYYLMIATGKKVWEPLRYGIADGCASFSEEESEARTADELPALAIYVGGERRVSRSDHVDLVAERNCN